jgi:dipeptidyl aminopeptidase/acylaminoacyl peptidase
LTALPATLTPEQFAQRLSSQAPPAGSAESQEKVTGSTVLVYRSRVAGSGNRNSQAQQGPWNLDYSLRDLVLVTVDSGAVRRIDTGHRIATYRPSPDGSHVAETIPKTFENPGSQQILFDLIVLSLETGVPEILARDIRLRYDGSTFSWSPNSSNLVYQTGGPSSSEGIGDCYITGLTNSTVKNITGFDSSRDRRITTPLWAPDGRHVYLLHDEAIWTASLDGSKALPLARIPKHRLIDILGKRESLLLTNDNREIVVLTYNDELKQSGFYGVDLGTGEGVKLLEQNQSYVANQEHAVVPSPDGKLVAFFAEDAQHSQELWLASPDFHNPRRLTLINPQLDKYQLGSARLISWRSLDGEQLHGALLMPADYEPGKTYPLITCVYGGASLSNYLVEFGPECGGMNMQLFATRGYAVLLPDAPQRLGTPMLDLIKTVLPGVDKVIEMGVADPGRLGVMGHSYGGYGVLALLVQTKRFRAAVSADGDGDITAFYGQMTKDGSAFGQSVAENGQGAMGGPPWQFPQRYIENSPVFYLDRVETPLLIVHGAADPTVLPFLADETFVGLRRLGKEVVYAKYEDEGHSPPYWSYPNQLDFSTRVIAWFGDHLKEQSPSLAKESSARN